VKEKTEKALFNIAKYGLIHTPALIVSMKLLIDMFASLSSIPAERPFNIFFGIVVDLSCQYFRARARAYNRYRPNGYQWRLFWLWFLIGIYIIGCSSLAAVGVFFGEVNAVEDKQEIVSLSRQAAIDNYNRIKAELTAKTASRNDEEKRISKSGISRGANYQKLDKEVKQLTADLAAAESKVKSYGEDRNNSKQTPFQALQSILGLPEQWFKTIIIVCGLLINFSLLLITPWELPKKLVLHELEPNNTTIGTESITPPVTDVTPKNSVTPEMIQKHFKPARPVSDGELMKCECGCGKTFPTGHNRRFYDGACRTRYFRDKSGEGEIKEG
jgi:hypothetical protein